MSIAEIREAALKLDEGDRVRLAEELLASLDRPTPLIADDDPNIESRLLQRLADPRPDVEATPEFWRRLKNRVRAHPSDSRQQP